jgi:hypothetical protein
MNSPKTRFVIISAIGLVSIVGIFVSAQSLAPTASDQNLPVHLVVACAKVNKDDLKAALTPRPSDTYKFQYKPEGSSPIEDLGGSLPPISPPPCSSDRLNGNATQRAMFKNTKELHKFLVDAGL